MSARPRKRPLSASDPSARRAIRSSSSGSASSSGATPSGSSAAINRAATLARPRGARVAAWFARYSSASAKAAGSIPSTRSR